MNDYLGKYTQFPQKWIFWTVVN